MIRIGVIRSRPAILAAAVIACATLGAGSDALAKRMRSPSPVPGERADVRAACAYAAQIPPEVVADHTLRAGVFDIDGDGSSETVLGTVADGTMGGDAFEIRDASGRSVAWTQPDVRDGADLLLGARWMPFRGRAYLLGFTDESAGFLARLSYPDADHTLRVGCRFTTTVEELFLPTADGSAELCGAVTDGRAEVVAVVDTSGKAGGRAWSSVDGRVEVDLDGTGRKVPLRRLRYVSSAGRGCDASYFDTAAAIEGGSDDAMHRDLMELQRVAVDDGGADYTPGECGGLTRRWLRIGGRTYLETRYPSEEPHSDRQLVHRLQGVVAGRPRTVCEATFTRRWSLAPERR